MIIVMITKDDQLNNEILRDIIKTKVMIFCAMNKGS